MKKSLVLTLAVALTALSAAAQLHIADNPRYFLDGDKPVVLFGSGLWTIIPDATIDIEDHNSWYAKYGANANRAALYSFCTSVGDGNGIAPWERTGPGNARDGKPKFDLTKPNEAFWARANAYFESCRKHGIYVWLQIFGEPFVEGADERWGINPFNADNNINALPGLPGGSGSGEEAFYDPDNAALMAVQDALVRRLLDETVGRHENIIYEIGNEINMDSVTRKAKAWQRHWVEFFADYGRDHGVKLLLANDTRRDLFENDAAGFPVVNHHGFHGINMAREEKSEIVRRMYEAVVEDFDRYRRPIVNSRPCSDPDRVKYNDIIAPESGRALYWTYFFAGGHIVGFRTTEESWKGGDTAERIIQHLRAFIDTLPFVRMTPAPEVVTDGQALCLVAPGAALAAYLPEGGAVTLNLDAGGARVTAAWYTPETGEWGETETFEANGPRTFRAPDGAERALRILPAAD